LSRQARQVATGTNMRRGARSQFRDQEMPGWRGADRSLTLSVRCILLWGGLDVHQHIRHPMQHLFDGDAYFGGDLVRLAHGDVGVV